jgi:hypothetical protein
LSDWRAKLTAGEELAARKAILNDVFEALTATTATATTAPVTPGQWTAIKRYVVDKAAVKRVKRKRPCKGCGKKKRAGR